MLSWWARACCSQVWSDFSLLWNSQMTRAYPAFHVSVCPTVPWDRYRISYGTPSHTLANSWLPKILSWAPASHVSMLSHFTVGRRVYVNHSVLSHVVRVQHNYGSVCHEYFRLSLLEINLRLRYPDILIRAN